MKNIDLNGKIVLDFGTGTGILAILAKKSGAKKIYAIDNDDWSIANAEENFKKNNCAKIILKKASEVSSEIKFDIILANINKNVILDNLETLAGSLNPGGTILFSGLLQSDKQVLIESAKNLGLNIEKDLTKNNWIAVQFLSKCA